MDQKEFQTNIRAADMFRRLTDKIEETEFWAGYMRGLRRNYHGKRFGTEKEHALWMSLADDDRDLTRKMRGLGYRIGFEGQGVQQAMKAIQAILTP